MSRKYYLRSTSSGIFKSLYQHIFFKPIPLFPETVLLETQSGCNARCIFCPYLAERDKLPQGKMSQQLFEKILTEFTVHAPKYLIPCFMNEPLMDKHLVTKLKQIKAIVPTIRIKLTTNGSLLTPELAEQLVEENLLYEITVSFNGHSKETFERLMQGLHYEKCRDNLLYLLEYVRKKGVHTPRIKINMLKMKAVAHELDKAVHYWQEKGAELVVNPYENRGGVMEKNPHFSPKMHPYWNCRRVFNTMVITFDGKVPICCVDYTRKVLIGDVHQESLFDIWNSPAFTMIRKQFLEGRQAEISICKDCMVGE